MDNSWNVIRRGVTQYKMFIQKKKKKEVPLFVSVIAPVKNPAGRPTIPFLASKEKRGTFLLPWEKSLFGLLKQQFRIKEWHNSFLEESGWILCHFRKVRVMYQEWQTARKENYEETS